MDSAKFNLNGMWRCFSESGNDTLSFSVFNGNPALVMFKKGSDTRKPDLRLPLTISHVLAWTSMIESILSAQPETRIPFVQTKYNQDTRTYEPDTNYVLEKTSTKTYVLEISSKAIPTPIRFKFKCPNSFALGDSMTEEQRSAYGLRELLTILKTYVPICSVASRLNMEQRQGGQRRQGNGGNNNGGYRNNNNSGGSENSGGDPYSVFD